MTVRSLLLYLSLVDCVWFLSFFHFSASLLVNKRVHINDSKTQIMWFSVHKFTSSIFATTNESIKLYGELCVYVFVTTKIPLICYLLPTRLVSWFSFYF